jgi:phosphoribosylaminoimidazole-succinocarboxamide synthase
VTRSDIENNYAAFRFANTSDIDRYENLLREGFEVISAELSKLDQIFVDTKFEFGYVTDQSGNEKLIYMDEVGTPDSSRIWDGPAYREGRVVENSKEEFRKLLLNYFPDPDILTNKDRMDERPALARDNALPEQIMMQTSATYLSIAEKITGAALALSDNPRAEIIDILNTEFGVIV